MANKYLEKVATKWEDEDEDYRPYSPTSQDLHYERLSERMDAIDSGNQTLIDRGYLPTIPDSSVGAANARVLSNAIYQTKVRPNQGSAAGWGVLGGAALGTLGAVTTGHYTKNPGLALGAGIIGAIGGGKLTSKLYYNDARKAEDDRSQANANAYLDKVLSKYQKDPHE